MMPARGRVFRQLYLSAHADNKFFRVPAGKKPGKEKTAILLDTGQLIVVTKGAALMGRWMTPAPALEL